MEYEFDIFLSHNSADKTWVKKLAFDIENDSRGKGLKVFLDEWDILKSGNIPEEVSLALGKSNYLGFVLSPKAIKSNWVTSEWTAKFMSDQFSGRKSIIPLMYKHCEVPTLIAAINYIDFTSNSEYDSSLRSLINTLRGVKPQRGEYKSLDEVNLSNDKALLHQYLTVFARPAFRVSCIEELSLKELIEAIDATQMAINTGKLYSRSNLLIGDFEKVSSFKSTQFIENFSLMSENLIGLKKLVLKFVDFYEKEGDADILNNNFYSIARDLLEKGDTFFLKKALKWMDQIDIKRNDILSHINVLLNDSEKNLKLIELSSDLIKRGGFAEFSISLDS